MRMYLCLPLCVCGGGGEGGERERERERERCFLLFLAEAGVAAKFGRAEFSGSIELSPP